MRDWYHQPNVFYRSTSPSYVLLCTYGCVCVGGVITRAWKWGMRTTLLDVLCLFFCFVCFSEWQPTFTVLVYQHFVILIMVIFSFKQRLMGWLGLSCFSWAVIWMICGDVVIGKNTFRTVRSYGKTVATICWAAVCASVNASVDECGLTNDVLVTVLCCLKELRWADCITRGYFNGS